MQEMERYCAAHPGSPAAVRRPRLSIRGRTFVALLGPTIEEGIAGFGDSVRAALRAFDAQILPLSHGPLIGIRSLNPPSKGCREKARVALDSPQSAVNVAIAQPVSIFASASRATVLTERRNAHLRSETVPG
jgi:hypothetical protein